MVRCWVVDFGRGGRFCGGCGNKEEQASEKRHTHATVLIFLSIR
jgi:hypothetical protein